MNASTLKKEQTSPFVFVKLRRPTPSIVFDTYWKFASERQNVYMRRVEGKPGPWTSDEIIDSYKFTNTYRAADRVSQYLIKHVLYGGKYSAEDTIFRTLLFKIFNKIETWELISREVPDEITLANFDLDRWCQVLDKAKSNKTSIYSAAYIMPSGKSDNPKSNTKHRFHLELLKSLHENGFYSSLIESHSMKEAYEKLLSLPSIGSFLAYQYVIDLNYSDVFQFSENDYVMPGPGAKDGIKKCFKDLGDYTEEDIIKMMVDEQDEHFNRLNLDFKSLWGRELQLIDCQNLFCESDKYARVAHPDISGFSGRTRIKQKYSPTSLPQEKPWFPPKWDLNDKIESNLKSLNVSMIPSKGESYLLI